jgi:Ran GTPase-activating protein (RanGAP) involved in mRNA processing and transport
MSQSIKEFEEKVMDFKNRHFIKDHEGRTHVFLRGDSMMLQSKKLTNEDAKIIAKILQDDTTTTFLDLSGNKIGYYGMFKILESILGNKDSKIEWLNLKKQDPKFMEDTFRTNFNIDTHLTIIRNIKKRYDHLPKLYTIDLSKNFMISDRYNKILAEYLNCFTQLDTIIINKSTLTTTFIKDIISTSINSKTTKSCV